MIARAPGKLVLSGAYAVLEGAPAIVTAVDRYVVADASRAPAFVTPELRAAFGDAPAPWFDASALRDGSNKLGLGSSAAIVVACLASAELARSGALPDAALRDRVYPAALAAHRAAQPSGSGVDVAAACHGGCLSARREDGELATAPIALPHELRLVVWSSGVPASTPDLLARVHRLKEARPAEHSALLGRQGEASERALQAAVAGNGRDLIRALDAQRLALAELGHAAGASIVTPEAARLADLATRDGSAVLPSGAGGGDVTLYVGLEPPSAELRRLAASLGQTELALSWNARGVHAAAT